MEHFFCDEIILLSLQRSATEMKVLGNRLKYCNQNIEFNIDSYASGTYMIEIKSCYDKVMQTKIVKI